MKSQAANGTWFENPIPRADLPDGVVPIRTQWVFKLKFKDGVPHRFKARLVARGDQQTMDSYGSTFAPTSRWPTIRSFLALANQHDMDMRHLDVKTAFLIPELPPEERVFIQVPEGVTGVPAGHVLELRKSMYGLKQAAAAWNKNIDKTLKNLGFVASEADPCLYLRFDARGVLRAMLLLYVDDILLAGAPNDVAKMIEAVAQHYDITDDGEPSFFLGASITRDRRNRTISISQEAYVNKILQRFHMEGCVPSDSPAGERRLSKDMCPQSEEEQRFMNSVPYRQAVGALLYLSVVSRPDISQAVAQVAQFNANPGKAHWSAVKRIIRYVAGTAARSITFRHQSSFSLVGYSDSDDAGCPDTAKSTSGFIFFFGGAPVSWRSRKQKVVTLSSCESELVALSEASREVVWIRKLFAQIYSRVLPPTFIFEDNDCARKIAEQPKFSDKTKHIKRKYFYVQAQVASGEMNVRRVDTKINLADIFTKPADRATFVRLTAKIFSGRIRPSDHVVL